MATDRLMAFFHEGLGEGKQTSAKRTSDLKASDLHRAAHGWLSVGATNHLCSHTSFAGHSDQETGALWQNGEEYRKAALWQFAARPTFRLLVVWVNWIVLIRSGHIDFTQVPGKSMKI